jgi:hypothetical protein
MAMRSARRPNGARVNGAVLAPQEVSGMVARCEVLRMAGELCSQLAGERIPDDFEVAGEYSQTVSAVRQRYTNYEALLDALPDCPIADRVGDPIGPGCTNYDLAHDILRTSARRLALELYCKWHAGRELPPKGR